MKNGYLEIPAEWLAANPTFTLSIPLEARLIASHPFTNQNTLSLARGPIVYCVEDIDNPWVEDHFKVSTGVSVSNLLSLLIYDQSVQLDPHCKLTEESVNDSESGDQFVGVTVINGAYAIDVQDV